MPAVNNDQVISRVKNRKKSKDTVPVETVFVIFVVSKRCKVIIGLYTFSNIYPALPDLPLEYLLYSPFGQFAILKFLCFETNSVKYKID